MSAEQCSKGVEDFTVRMFSKPRECYLIPHTGVIKKIPITDFPGSTASDLHTKTLIVEYIWHKDSGHKIGTMDTLVVTWDQNAVLEQPNQHLKNLFGDVYIVNRFDPCKLADTEFKESLLGEYTWLMKFDCATHYGFSIGRDRFRDVSVTLRSFQLSVGPQGKVFTLYRMAAETCYNIHDVSMEGIWEYTLPVLESFGHTEAERVVLADPKTRRIGGRLLLLKTFRAVVELTTQVEVAMNEYLRLHGVGFRLNLVDSVNDWMTFAKNCDYDRPKLTCFEYGKWFSKKLQCAHERYEKDKAQQAFNLQIEVDKEIHTRKVKEIEEYEAKMENLKEKLRRAKITMERERAASSSTSGFTPKSTTPVATRHSNLSSTLAHEVHILPFQRDLRRAAAEGRKKKAKIAAMVVKQQKKNEMEKKTKKNEEPPPPPPAPSIGSVLEGAITEALTKREM